MENSIKSRLISIDMGKTTYSVGFNGSTLIDKVAEWNNFSKQTLSSAGHRWPRRKFLPYVDSGGGFSVITPEYQSNSGALKIDHSQGGFHYKCEGPWLPFAPSVPIASVPSINDLYYWGTAGYNRTAPTKPQANAGEFLGELRDLPKLDADAVWDFRRKTEYFWRLERDHKQLAKLGKSYLSVEFGWKPFIRDLQEILKQYVEVGKHVEQLERDSGKVVHRKSQLLNERSHTTQSTSSSGFPAMAYIVNTPGKLDITRITTKQVTFSAAYTYYMQPKTQLLGLRRGEQILRIVFGASLTPSVLWELAPWSWLVDYRGNVGTVIENLTIFNNDNLVALYAYLMYTTTVAEHAGLSGVLFCDNQRRSTSSIGTVTSKVRFQGSPYGFSVSPKPLSDKQKTILAALGLSRTHL